VVPAQAVEQPSNGREMPLLPAASCRNLPPVQFLRNGGQRNNASGSKLTDSGSQGLGTRIGNSFACRTTIAPPIARGSQASFIRHFRHTLRATKISSSKPATVTSGHSKSRQALGLDPSI
jgi:hypothetical protein